MDTIQLPAKVFKKKKKENKNQVVTPRSATELLVLTLCVGLPNLIQQVFTELPNKCPALYLVL